MLFRSHPQASTGTQPNAASVHRGGTLQSTQPSTIVRVCVCVCVKGRSSRAAHQIRTRPCARTVDHPRDLCMDYWIHTRRIDMYCFPSSCLVVILLLLVIHPADTIITQFNPRRVSFAQDKSASHFYGTVVSTFVPWIKKVISILFIAIQPTFPILP